MLQQQKGNLKHLVCKATVHCVCPVNLIQHTNGQGEQLVAHDSIGIALEWIFEIMLSAARRIQVQCYLKRTQH